MIGKGRRHRLRPSPALFPVSPARCGKIWISRRDVDLEGRGFLGRNGKDCHHRSSQPKCLPWRVAEEERATICAVRGATGFPLDELTFVLRHFLPHLNRDNIYRVLKAEGLNRRPS